MRVVDDNIAFLAKPTCLSRRPLILLCSQGCFDYAMTAAWIYGLWRWAGSHFIVSPPLFCSKRKGTIGKVSSTCQTHEGQKDDGNWLNYTIQVTPRSVVSQLCLATVRWPAIALVTISQRAIKSRAKSLRYLGPCIGQEQQNHSLLWFLGGMLPLFLWAAPWVGSRCSACGTGSSLVTPESERQQTSKRNPSWEQLPWD